MRKYAVFLLLASSWSCAAVAPSGESAVYLQVLGVAQDAGYPQSGCYREHCQRAWHDQSLRRNVSCIALVDDRSKKKFLFDATPDLPQQLQMLEESAPDRSHTLAAVFLTHGHMGHYTGLMHFGREARGSEGIAVMAAPRMFQFLAQNGPWSQLVALGNIQLLGMPIDQAIHMEPDISVKAMLVPHRDEFTETLAFQIEGPHKSALYLPDIDKWDRWDTDIKSLIHAVDYAFLDATFLTVEELPGRNMSEIPHPFVEESLALFKDLDPIDKDKIWFIHFNHTNPLLVEGSAAQKKIEALGFHVARQGIRLPM